MNSAKLTAADCTHGYAEDTRVYCAKCAFQAGAEAMREACAKEIEKPENRTVGLADGVQQEYAKVVRSLPLPGGGGKG